MKLLHPLLQQIIPHFKLDCEKKGLKISIKDTFRTQQQQDELYAQGRTKPCVILTNYKYPYSSHCWGVSFDFYIYYSENTNFYTLINKAHKIGSKYNLHLRQTLYGTSFKFHMELEEFIQNSSTQSLLEKYRTPDIFIKDWKKFNI